MAKEDAKTEYETAKSDIANLLGFFECELSKTPKEINWTHVGSLKHVRQSLMETLSFLSGIQVRDIEDTLEETRLCRKEAAEGNSGKTYAGIED